MMNKMTRRGFLAGAAATGLTACASGKNLTSMIEFAVAARHRIPGIPKLPNHELMLDLGYRDHLGDETYRNTQPIDPEVVQDIKVNGLTWDMVQHPDTCFTVARPHTCNPLEKDKVAAKEYIEAELKKTYGKHVEVIMYEHNECPLPPRNNDNDSSNNNSRPDTPSTPDSSGSGGCNGGGCGGGGSEPSGPSGGAGGPPGPNNDAGPRI